jgi:hypothetical protein
LSSISRTLRLVSLLTFFLTSFAVASAQFTTQQGGPLYALNAERKVFALSPDNKLAVSLKNDPVNTHPARLTSFDPLTGTEVDQETFGFGPLGVAMAPTSAGLRVVVLTSEGGPRRIYLFELTAQGQLNQVASTQLTTSNSDFGSAMVLSSNGDVGFVVVADAGLVTFSLTTGAVLNATPLNSGVLALFEGPGKRTLVLRTTTQMRLIDVINPSQPVVLGDVSFPTNSEFSGSIGAPPVFSKDGKYVFSTSQFTDFGVVDVDTRQIVSSISGQNLRFSRVSIFEDGQHRLLALHSTGSGTVNSSEILLIDATNPAQLVTLKQFTQPDGIGPKSGSAFTKDGNGLYLLAGKKIISYSLPNFSIAWEKTAPAQNLTAHQLEAYGDDEVIAAWMVNDGGGLETMFGAFPKNLPDVSVNDVPVNEPDSGSVTADFTVTLSAASNHKVTVSYSTSADTATQNSDFTGKTGTVVFQPGETSKNVSIDVLGDTLDEPDETFKLILNSVDVGILIRAQGTATIVDNDPPPSVSVADVLRSEGDLNTNMTFVVTLSQASGKTITINYATADGTATAGSDYVATAGTLTFSPGQTSANVNVGILADIDIEPTEDLTFNLSSPANVVISDGQAIGTLINDDFPGISFRAASFGVNENTANLPLTVFRKGDSSLPATVDYRTSDSSGAAQCNATSGLASSRCDYITTLGTLQFGVGETTKTIRVPLINDVYIEGTETFTVVLSNPTGAPLGTPSVATVNILDNDFSQVQNPINNASFFVRQHYIDFLNREPDGAGLAFWSNEITSCGSDQACIEVKRINVSAAFFLSIEFQDTGYLVYRTYKSAFGNLSGKPVPVRFLDLLRDTQQVGAGIQVGIGNWEAQLEVNRQAYATAFVQRADFVAAYPTTLTSDQFVNQMNTNAGGPLSDSEKANLVTLLGGTPSDISRRAAVLRAIADDADLRNAEFNRSFVLMQYFGYMRRDPDDVPDTDFSGYNFWLTKLEQFNGNFVNAEMVKAFITSGEYRARFGP